MPIAGQATLPQEPKKDGVARSAKGLAKITNRAEKGPLKGLPFMDAFNGEAFPEGAKSDDTKTWLQAGESVVVAMEVALHVCGNVWGDDKSEGRDIINRFGGYQYLQTPEANTGRSPALRISGPPSVPDLLVASVDARGTAGEAISIYDKYVPKESIPASHTDRAAQNIKQAPADK